MRNLTQKELRELSIHRLLTNDNESQSLFERYTEDENNGNFVGEFDDFLNECYRDLGSDYDEIFEDIENKVIDCLKNNQCYLD